MMNNIKDKLLLFCLNKLPKLLTHLDRDSDSLTYGCFDRDYWHYKVRDYCSLILQQAGFLLAFVWNYKDNKNIYYHNNIIKEWAKASILFWASNINRDGSADEYYPFEKSIPAVAFSLYRINQALCLINDFTVAQKKIIADSQCRAADFLILNAETKASNQEMASAIAVLLTGKLLNEDKYVLGANKKICQLLNNNYSNEGWFIEYGGADIGYLSITLEALVDYYEYSKDNSLLNIIKKIVEFSNYGIFCNGTVGGQFNSRNTEYYLPYGLFKSIEIVSDINKNAYIKIIKAFDSYLQCHSNFDDRYFLHYTLPSFFKTLLVDIKNIDYCDKIIDNKFLPNSGWFYKNDGRNEIHIALNKGGIIKVISDGKVFFSDYGYRITKNNNTVGVTNWQNGTKYEFQDINNFIIKGKFTKVKFKKSKPIYHAILRIMSYLFGRKIVNLLKKKLIFIDKKINIYFERQIKFQNEILHIYDKVSSEFSINNLHKALKYSLRHVASSKSFMIDELNNDLENNCFNINNKSGKNFVLRLQINLNLKQVNVLENTTD